MPEILTVIGTEALLHNLRERTYSFNIHLSEPIIIFSTAVKLLLPILFRNEDSDISDKGWICALHTHR